MDASTLVCSPATLFMDRGTKAFVSFLCHVVYALSVVCLKIPETLKIFAANVWMTCNKIIIRKRGLELQASPSSNIHPCIYRKKNRLLLHGERMQLSFVAACPDQSHRRCGPVPAHTGQDHTLDKPLFYHQAKTHIDKKTHSHSSLLMIPTVSRAEGEYPPPVISLCLTKTNTWNRLDTMWWDGEDFQKCIKQQAIKYRPGGVKVTATLSAPQPLFGRCNDMRTREESNKRRGEETINNAAFTVYSWQ